MQISAKGKAKLTQLEGDKLVAYQDQAGVWTIGRGHTGADVKPGMRITQARSDQLFDKDLAVRDRQLTKALKGAKVTQDQYDALQMWYYNTGANLYSSSVMKAVRAGQLHKLPALIKAWKYVTVNGKKVVSKGLVSRRAQEVKYAKWPTSTASKVTKTVVGVSTGAGAGGVVYENVDAVKQSVDPIADVQPILDSVGILGYSGSTVLAAIGSMIVIGVMGFLVYKLVTKKDE